MEHLEPSITKILTDIVDRVSREQIDDIYVNPVIEIEDRLIAINRNIREDANAWWWSVVQFLDEYSDSMFHGFPNVGNMSLDEANALFEELRKGLQKEPPIIPPEIIEYFDRRQNG